MNPTHLLQKLLLAVTLCGGLASTSLLAQDVLYWTDTSDQWVTAPDLSQVSAQWALTSGGPRDQKWQNGFSAIIEQSNAQLILSPNDRLISVIDLTITHTATLVGSGNNTRILEIKGNGSGNLYLGTTSAASAANGSFLRLDSTTAWSGTIGTNVVDPAIAAKNRIQIRSAEAVGKSTALDINGGRVELSAGSGSQVSFTIGTLEGTGGELRFDLSNGMVKTLIVDQDSDSVYSGAITRTTATGSSAVLVKEGIGSLTLSGSLGTDRIEVRNGSLVLDATATAVSVFDGGRLEGSGTADRVILNAGGTIRYLLGSTDSLSIGTLEKGTNGPYVFDFGGTGVIGETYVLATSLIGDFYAADFSAVNLAQGVLGHFEINGSELSFVAVQIPEASTCITALAAIALLGTLLVRRSCGVRR